MLAYHMKTDKLFVLSLVILLPLTGCIDVSDNAEADENDDVVAQNNPPVIYGMARFADYYDYDTSTLHEDVITVQAMAKDFDGVVVDLGVDVDLDGVIDFNANDIENYTLEMVSNGSDWMNPVPWNPSGFTMDVEYCYQWLSLIALDDDGAMDIEPFKAVFEWDDETETCMNEVN